MNNQPSIVDKLREGAKRGDRSRGDVQAEEEGRRDDVQAERMAANDDGDDVQANGAHVDDGCEMTVRDDVCASDMTIQGAANASVS